MKRGSAGILRTDREMRGGLAHNGGDVRGGWLNAEGAERGYAEVAESTEDAGRRGAGLVKCGRGVWSLPREISCV